MTVKRSPKLKVNVSQHHIDRAVQANSKYCMIAEAIKEQYPELSHIAVDLQSIRATDRKKGLRYMYMTPRVAQLALIMFDEGELFRPISFTLKGAHTVGAAITTHREKGKPIKRRTKLGRKQMIGKARNKPDLIGGRPLPRHASSKGVREFGVRAFTKKDIAVAKGQAA